MNDPPGVPSALGIEAVECFSEGATLTVRVTGRWRRRRPEAHGRATLVIEALGRRHRFPALPEPPAVSGPLPGTWRVSFSVPAELAPYLSGRTWLVLGSVVVPLPVAMATELGEVSLPGGPAPQSAGPPSAGESEVPEDPSRARRAAEDDPPPGAGHADPQTLAMRELRSYELAVQGARRRAAEAEAAAAELAVTVQRLEQELEQVRREPQSLRRLLDEAELQQREAAQLAHAEHARRLEAEEERARYERDLHAARLALEQLAALEEQVREREAELDEVRRAADEAEQLAATAHLARKRAEHQLQEVAGRAPSRDSPARSSPGRDSPSRDSPARQGRILEPLRSELALARSLRAVVHVPTLQIQALPGGSPPELRAVRHEREMMRRYRAVARRQLASRSHSGDPQLSATLAQLREELERLRTIAEQERSARAGAEERVRRLEDELAEQDARATRAFHAIEQFRAELGELRSANPRGRGSEGAEPVEADRLRAALDRLREERPPLAERPPPPAERPPLPAERWPPSPEERPAPAEERPPLPPEEPGEGPSLLRGPGAKPWLAHVFRALTARDASAAGRLLIALLPAQQIVDPRPVAYDLVLGKETCVRVTSGAPAALVELTEEARPLGDVDFRVSGDPAAIARLLAAGRVRRLLGRGVARVRGNRERLVTLERLIAFPLTLSELAAAGVSVEPELALTLVSLMIDPAWTAGERFTVAHRIPEASRAGAYLHVRGGRPPAASGATPQTAADTTIVCGQAALLPALEGSGAPEVVVEGKARPISLLRRWVQRAQSG